MNCPVHGTKISREHKLPNLNSLKDNANETSSVMKKITNGDPLSVSEYLLGYAEETAEDLSDPSDKESVLLSGYWYQSADVFHNCLDGKAPRYNAGGYEEDLVQQTERRFLLMESKVKQVEGTLHRGVTTVEKFSNNREWNKSVKEKFPIGSTITQGFLSTSRSPLIGLTFSSGEAILPVSVRNTEDITDRKLQLGSSEKSGYVMQIVEAEGFHVVAKGGNDQDSYNYRNEKEVVLLPHELHITGFESAESSLTGKPTVIAEYIESTPVDLMKSAKIIQDS